MFLGAKRPPMVIRKVSLPTKKSDDSKFKKPSSSSSSSSSTHKAASSTSHHTSGRDSAAAQDRKRKHSLLRPDDALRKPQQQRSSSSPAASRRKAVAKRKAPTPTLQTFSSESSDDDDNESGFDDINVDGVRRKRARPSPGFHTRETLSPDPNRSIWDLTAAERQGKGSAEEEGRFRHAIDLTTGAYAREYQDVFDGEGEAEKAVVRLRYPSGFRPEK
jgi:hypothetical protein